MGMSNFGGRHLGFFWNLFQRACPTSLGYNFKDRVTEKHIISASNI